MSTAAIIVLNGNKPYCIVSVEAGKIKKVSITHYKVISRDILHKLREILTGI